ncbi:MAG: tetratricopeptide repeat protein [Hyphomicrobiales bacterium]|nr:tetratricopeptide repeat protein [Hyphomicrobiales bacterium]
MGKGILALVKPAIVCAALTLVAAWPAGAAVSEGKDAKIPDACAGHPDAEKQINACSDYLDKHPRSAIAYHARALAFMRIGSGKEAIADLSLAIKLDPKYKEAYNNRGISLRLVGRNDEAIKDFSKTIELDPKYAVGYVGRGISRMVKRDFDGAAKDFEAAIKIDPKLGAAYRNYGNLLVQLQRFQDAIAYYNQALVQDISDADAYYNRAIAYEALRNYNIAIMNYRLALKYNSQLVAAAKALERLGIDPKSGK